MYDDGTYVKLKCYLPTKFQVEVVIISLISKFAALSLSSSCRILKWSKRCDFPRFHILYIVAIVVTSLIKNLVIPNTTQSSHAVNVSPSQNSFSH